MTFNAEQLRADLRKFMKNAQINVNRWERASDLGDGTLRKFLDGLTETMTDKSLEKLAAGATQLLGREVTKHELQGIHISHNGAVPSGGTLGRTSSLEPVKNASDKSVSTLVQWKLAFGETGRQGAFVLSSENVGSIEWPDTGALTKKAFCCKLLDNANGPGYKAGHTVIVDPLQGPIVGDLCIFTDDPMLPSGSESIAAIFVGHDSTHWVVTQNVVKDPQRLCRKTYPQAWPVVVHLPRGA